MPGELWRAPQQMARGASYCHDKSLRVSGRGDSVSLTLIACPGDSGMPFHISRTRRGARMTLSSAATTIQPDTYDPLNEQVKQNPYPYYAKMRAGEPVKYLPHMDAYAVASYEGVDKVLKDHKLFSSQHFWPELLGEYDPVERKSGV